MPTGVEARYWGSPLGPGIRTLEIQWQPELGAFRYEWQAVARTASWPSRWNDSADGGLANWVRLATDLTAAQIKVRVRTRFDTLTGYGSPVQRAVRFNNPARGFSAHSVGTIPAFTLTGGDREFTIRVNPAPGQVAYRVGWQVGSQDEVVSEVYRARGETVETRLNGECQVRVIAYSKNRVRSSGRQSVTLRALAPPGKPVVTLTPTQVGCQAAWTASPAGNNYSIRHRKQGDSWPTRALTTTSTSHPITGYRAGDVVEVQVRAHNADGNSDWSDLKRATVLSAPTGPQPPTPTGELRAPTISGVQASATTLRVNWALLTGAVQWQVWWYRGNALLGTSGRLGARSTNYTITGLLANTSYRIGVAGYSRPSGGSALVRGDIAWVSHATASADALPPPTGLHGTATSDSVTLTWDAEPTATSWNILYRQAQLTVDNGRFIADGRATSHTITGLRPQTRYVFRLRYNGQRDARGRRIRGTYTDFLSLTTLAPTAIVPRVPANVAAVAGDRRITVTWDPDPAEATAGITYDIRWGPAPGNFNAQTIPNIASNRQVITAGVVNNTQYQVQVRAKNRDGATTAWSSPVLVTPVGTPVAVTGFTLTASRNYIIGRWDPVTNAGANVRYEVWLRNRAHVAAGVTGWSQLTTADSTFAFTVGFSETWEAQVRVHTDGGDAPWAGPLRVTTAAMAPPPMELAAPVMNPAVVNGNLIIWDWTPVDGAQIYDFQWRADEDDSVWVTVPRHGTSYTMTGEWETSYKGRVRARNEVTTSDPSNEVTAAVGADPRVLGQLDAPTGVVASQAQGHPDASYIRLDWEPVPNAIQYEVNARVGDGEWLDFPRVADEYNWYEFDGQWDTTYRFRVKAIGGFGVRDSDWSAEAEYTTPADLPPKPRAWTLTRAFTSVTAAWQAVRAATSYTLRWRVKAAAGATTVNDWENHQTTRRSKTVDDLEPRTTYQFQLTGRNSSSTAANLNWSDIKEITTGDRPVQEVSAPNVPRGLQTNASGARIWAAWREPAIDSSHDAATSYDLEYWRVTSDREYRSGIRATIWGTDVTESGSWSIRVRAVNAGGTSAWVTGAAVRVTLPAPDAIPETPDYLWLDIGDGRGGRDHWGRVLSISGRWGGTGKGYLDRAPSVQGQVVLANDDAAIDIQGVRINTTIRFGSAFDGQVRDVLAGYIRDVSEAYDDELGQRTVTIAFSGLFDRLAQEDGEIGLFVAHDALTSDVVSGALTRSNIVGGAALVSHASTRIAPSQDMVLVSGGHNVMGVLRSMELAEGCVMHEGRGLNVTFPARWERAMTDALRNAAGHPEGEAVFARVDNDDDTPRIVVRNPEVEWFYEHLYTRIDLTGGQSSRTRRIKVAEYDGNASGNNPIAILNGSTYEPVINIYDSDRQGRNPWRVTEGIYEVSSWDPVQKDPTADSNSHVYFQDAAGNQITDSLVLGNIAVETVSQNSGGVRLRIRNTTTATVYVREIALWGFGIQRLANFQVTGANFAAENTYGIRKTLRLSRVAAGEGYNDSDNPVAELEAYKDFLLWRYSQPRYVARLAWRMQDRYPGEPATGMPWAQKQAYSLLVGDQVAVQDVNGVSLGNLPQGHYFVEGGDLSINNGTGERTAAVWVSRRDVIAAYTHDQDVTLTSAGTPWVTVGAAFANPLSVSPRRGNSGIAVVAIRAKRNGAVPDSTLTSSPSRYIMEVRVGGATTKGFVDRDFDDDYQWMTAMFVKTGPQVDVRIRQLAGGVTVTVAEIRAFEA